MTKENGQRIDEKLEKICIGLIFLVTVEIIM